MEVYLVGGAVRDELLGLPIKERDWVVVGATTQEMLSQGFKKVGKDFPVFLHPDTKEEYALARTERKSGSGYYGFEVYAEPTVTLEEDLLRRDLTINAMAKNDTGENIDPYGGQQDLSAKQLRHVSNAFTEDPLRVVRVARFAASLQPLGFTIAEETLQLMRHIVSTGEIKELAAERVWQETERALASQAPATFFSVLHEVHSMAQTHYGISQRFEDAQARELGIQSLTQIASLESDPCVRLATLIGGLYYYFPNDGSDDVQRLSEQLLIPKPCKELLKLTVNIQHQCHDVFDLDAKQLLSLAHRLDARRKPNRFHSLLNIFSVIYKNATYTETYPQADWLTLVSKKINEIDIGAWIKEGASSTELADNMERAQLELLKKLIQERES